MMTDQSIEDLASLAKEAVATVRALREQNASLLLRAQQWDTFAASPLPLTPGRLGAIAMSADVDGCSTYEEAGVAVARAVVGALLRPEAIAAGEDALVNTFALTDAIVRHVIEAAIAKAATLPPMAIVDAAHALPAIAEARRLLGTTAAESIADAARRVVAERDTAIADAECWRSVIADDTTLSALELEGVWDRSQQDTYGKSQSVRDRNACICVRAHVRGVLTERFKNDLATALGAPAEQLNDLLQRVRDLRSGLISAIEPNVYTERLAAIREAADLPLGTSEERWPVVIAALRSDAERWREATAPVETTGDEDERLCEYVKKEGWYNTKQLVNLVRERVQAQCAARAEAERNGRHRFAVGDHVDHVNGHVADGVVTHVGYQVRWRTGEMPGWEPEYQVKPAATTDAGREPRPGEVASAGDTVEHVWSSLGVGTVERVDAGIQFGVRVRWSNGERGAYQRGSLRVVRAPKAAEPTTPASAQEASDTERKVAFMNTTIRELLPSSSLVSCDLRAIWAGLVAAGVVRS